MEGLILQQWRDKLEGIKKYIMSDKERFCRYKHLIEEVNFVVLLSYIILTALHSPLNFSNITL